VRLPFLLCVAHSLFTFNLAASSLLSRLKTSMSERDGDVAAAATPFITSSTHTQTPGYRRITSFEVAQGHRTMASRKKGGWVLAASYVSDWIVLIIVAVVGFVVGDITPNKRPFYLEDPNIS
jgi:hypothetical protein